MSLNSVVLQGRKATMKNVLLMVSVFLFASISYSAFAITAEEVMGNILEVYEDIDDYKAVVYTYKVGSMDVSESVFESQQPIATFNLFFRKPNEHAVQEIGRSRFGIFRNELLSTLGILKNFDLDLHGKDFIFGQECYMLEITSPTRPGELAKLWISPKEWQVQQFTIFIASVELITTRFKYPLTGRNRQLPMETRSFFPLSKQVLINRIMNYEVNTGLPSEIFEKRKSKGQSN